MCIIIILCYLTIYQLSKIKTKIPIYFVLMLPNGILLTILVKTVFKYFNLIF